MNLIQCSRNCKHQAEGYCCFDSIGKVTSTESGCAYYEEMLPDDLNGLTNGSGADNGNWMLG